MKTNSPDWPVLLFLFFTIAILYSCTTTLPESVKVAYAQLPEEIDYNVHVQPILSDRCYQCHGPDENSRKAGLRLDIEEDAFKKLESGKRAFLRGRVSQSESIHRLLSDDPDYQMPPPESELSISPREIAIIVKWLEQGAEWKPHWSFIPIEKPEVPNAQKDQLTYNEIDNFIQRKLVEEGLMPNESAEKERLLRRVTMDLTGLPPSIDEMDAFLKDNTDDAYETVVDRLLASTDHAERLTMEWMDVARYADSHGISFDGYRHSWPYREWLINAFAQNIPYDQFITHQVAGDLIPDADHQSKLATAFYRLNPLESSQGSIEEEFRVEYVSERTATTGTAFLGLTIECARCHDHKFDPVSQKEYYQLSAFFNTTEEMGLGPIDKDRAPTLMLFEPAEEITLDSLEKELFKYENRLQKDKKDYTVLKEYIKNLDDVSPEADAIASYSFDTIKTIKKDKNPKKKNKKKKEYEDIQILDNNKEAEAMLGVTLTDGIYGKAAYFDNEYDFISLKEIGRYDHMDPFSISAWIHPKDTLKGATTQTIIGNSQPYIAYFRGWDFILDTSNHLTVRLIHRLPDDYIEVKADEPIAYDKWTQVGFTYDGSRKADGVSIFINGKKASINVIADKLKRSIGSINGFKFVADTIPLRVGKSYRLWTFDGGIFKGAIDEVKVFGRRLSSLEMQYLGDKEDADPTPAMIREHAILHDESIRSMEEELKAIRKKRAALLDTIKEIMVMEEMENPRKTYILNKGLYDQHLEEVQVGTPAQVLSFAKELPNNRMGLAKWLTDPNNPLVSRVAINRYWQMIFGKGLVRTPQDFGIQGERPTHPQLLDWLAAEFIDSGWNLRYMLKKMVMSATYRQSSRVTPEQVRLDPENKLLSRSNAYRWPAEIIRDNILAASGLLYKKVGGPGVRPYQPEGLWEELGQTSYRLIKYKQDSTLNSYRRTMYTFMRRFAPHPFLTTFDATAREICLIKRDVTNSPLQALLLMNDPQVLEASRALSERIQMEACNDIQDQIRYGFRLATGVHPTEKQLGLLEDYYNESRVHYEENPSLADSILSVGLQPLAEGLNKEKTAALAMVANTIFNFDESYMKR